MSFVECLLGFQNRLSQRLRTRAFGLGPLDKDYRVTEKKRERERDGKLVQRPRLKPTGAMWA